MTSTEALPIRRRALSSQAIAVLETLSQQPADRMSIRELVELLRPGHGSRASTRASLSRTLRRLWRAGLVELKNDWGWTLTERHAELDTQLTQHEADPEAAYARELAAIERGAPGFFPYDSPAEYLEHKRWWNVHLKRYMRNSVVELTARGQEQI